jgi:uncharacterized membrane protein
MGNDLEASVPSQSQVTFQLHAPTELGVLSRSVSCTDRRHPNNLNPAPSRDGEAPVQEKVTPPAEEDTYPEGGKEAWLVVFGSFLSMVSSFGVMNTIAVIHAHLSKDQLKDQSSSDIGWIFGVYVFLSFFGGIQIGPLFDKYGPRWLLLAGSICLVGGLMSTSVCTGEHSFAGLRQAIS